MLQNQEENGIRMLAVTAWARTRIMDGNWVTPGDLWCFGVGQLPQDSSWDPTFLTPTLHPVQYLSQTSPSNQSSYPVGMFDKKNGEEASTPFSTIDPSFPVHYPITNRYMPLPSYRFAQLTSTCFRNTLREILIEPLRHLVYQLAQEAQAMRQDPCVRLSKIELDDILAMLRDERMWYVSSSHGNTRLAHHIPYIPVSTENMAPMTKSLLESLWREACAPLYQCRCSICDRALQRQAHAQGQPSSPLATAVLSPSQPSPVVVAVKQLEVNIVLEEEEGIQEIGNREEDMTTNIGVDVDALNTPITTLTPPETGSGSASDAESNRSRKRSSASIDEDEDGANDSSDGASPRRDISNTHENSSTVGSPRKRQRTMSSDSVEENEEIEIDSPLPPSSYNTARPRDIDIPMTISSEGSEGVHPTSSSPVSSIASSVSESSSSSPSSVSSDSSSLHSVATGPIILPSNRVNSIKPGVGIGIGPRSSDTVKIRGEDDTPSLLYDHQHRQEGIEEYYT